MFIAKFYIIKESLFIIIWDTKTFHVPKNHFNDMSQMLSTDTVDLNVTSLMPIINKSEATSDKTGLT